jgi:Ran GTPase-activating protein (RanGAP) involved in mRNA processing and transport
MEFIAEALKVNSSLETINIGQNSIQSEGALYLENALSVNSTLQSISIEHNLIGF